MDEIKRLDVDFSAESGAQSQPFCAQSQKTQSKQIVSDAEAQEVSQIVTNMKNMAVDISKELTIQDEKLDNLTELVDYANSRIQRNTRRVQKLL